MLAHRTELIATVRGSPDQFVLSPGRGGHRIGTSHTALLFRIFKYNADFALEQVRLNPCFSGGRRHPFHDIDPSCACTQAAAREAVKVLSAAIASRACAGIVDTVAHHIDACVDRQVPHQSNSVPSGVAQACHASSPSTSFKISSGPVMPAFRSLPASTMHSESRSA